MVICYVPLCLKRSDRGIKVDQNGRKVSFHEFPSDTVKREKWIRAIRRQGESCSEYHTPTDRSVVCSIHFREEDFVANLKIRRLQPDAVPSVFPDYPNYKPVKQKRQKVEITRASKNLAVADSLPSCSETPDAICLLAEVSSNLDNLPLEASVATQTYFPKENKSTSTILKTTHFKKRQNAYNTLKTNVCRLRKRVSKLKSSVRTLKLENKELRKRLDGNNAGKIKSLPSEKGGFLLEQLKDVDEKKPRWSTVAETIIRNS